MTSPDFDLIAWHNRNLLPNGHRVYWYRQEWFDEKTDARYIKVWSRTSQFPDHESEQYFNPDLIDATRYAFESVLPSNPGPSTLDGAGDAFLLPQPTAPTRPGGARSFTPEEWERINAVPMDRAIVASAGPCKPFHPNEVENPVLYRVLDIPDHKD